MEIEPFAFEKTITEYITEKYKLSDQFYLEVKKIDGRITSEAIHSYKKVEHSNFRYVKDLELFKEMCRKKYYDDPAEKRDKGYWWSEFIVTDILFELEHDLFNLDNIINIKHYDHTFLDKDGNYLDQLVRLDYIRGFKENRKGFVDYMPNYDWNSLRKHLKKHPLVLNFKEIEIPYYNVDYDGQKAFEMDVLFLGKWWPKDKDICYISYHDVILGDFDPLEVKQFIKK